MKGLLSLASLAVLVASASAHTIFQELHVNGVSAGHTVGIRVPTYDGPIENVNSNDIICNGGINPYRQPVSNVIIPVPAGATVTSEWHHTLDGATGSASDPVDASHKGPIMAYLAKVNSATQTSVTGLKWFKIYQDGYDPSTKTWAVDKMIANKGKVSFKIPDCIASGEYLLRVEMIALHAAGSYPGAQFYMECAQINITGGGSVTPANTVSFPGAYSGSDPGVKINIYQTLSGYTIPGPAPFTCSGSPGTTAAPTTAAPTTAPGTTLTTRPPVTSQPPTTTSVPQNLVAQWGQCGGSGYTGSTTCVSPYKCVKMNDFYSQCQ